jgi:FkbM family methyltransferase
MSQLEQDSTVIGKIYKGLLHGFFVELGAADGIKDSNTFLLEKNYKWNGICIEPNPDFHDALKKNRQCELSFDACFSKSGEEVEFVIGDSLSGIVPCIDKHMGVLVNKRIKLMTKTLSQVLDEKNAPSFINYLSLDTEGSELEVLNGIDFTRYTFGFMTIEHNYVEPKRSNIQRFLEEKGYKFYRSNQWDDFYILPDLDSRVHLDNPMTFINEIDGEYDCIISCKTTTDINFENKLSGLFPHLPCFCFADNLPSFPFNRIHNLRFIQKDLCDENTTFKVDITTILVRCSNVICITPRSKLRFIPELTFLRIKYLVIQDAAEDEIDHPMLKYYTMVSTTPRLYERIKPSS